MYQKIKTLADEAIAFAPVESAISPLDIANAALESIGAAELVQHKAGKPAFANLKAPEPKDSDVVLGVKTGADGSLTPYGTAVKKGAKK